MKKTNRNEEKGNSSENTILIQRRLMSVLLKVNTGLCKTMDDENKKYINLRCKKKNLIKGMSNNGSIFRYEHSSTIFAESKMELKKVKWPNRKELLASTAMVIFLVSGHVLFLGIIDFGLIKIIKNIVG